MRKVLIANRGEIAVRIIRACKKLGLEAITVHSSVDKESLHVKLADYSVLVGPGEASKSYLNVNAIMAAAKSLKVDAIHPGFGFLSENVALNRRCEKEGIIFIGPKAETIETFGDKIAAKTILKEHGIPMAPGSDGAVEGLEEGIKVAGQIGYPVMIKAAAGGGGCGLRVVRSKDEFPAAFHLVIKEAKMAFGDRRVYIEKLIENARHIEVQILADHYGKVIHLNTRECSLQRRSQKIIEEAPAPNLSDDLREKITQAAVKTAQISGYQNAGTVEFLLDENGNFYFIEMNTRIQVEHPVSELITGIDIVLAQLLIASGESIMLEQEDVGINGHAIECRINAEDPKNNFMPSPGVVEELTLPGGMGVRIDAGIVSGSRIPMEYDSMLLKLICHAEDRTLAAAVAKNALSELNIKGLHTNEDFSRFILSHHDFLNCKINTKWVEQTAIPEYNGEK